MYYFALKKQIIFLFCFYCYLKGFFFLFSFFTLLQWIVNCYICVSQGQEDVYQTK